MAGIQELLTSGSILERQQTNFLVVFHNRPNFTNFTVDVNLVEAVVTQRVIVPTAVSSLIS